MPVYGLLFFYSLSNKLLIDSRPTIYSQVRIAIDGIATEVL